MTKVFPIILIIEMLIASAVCALKKEHYTASYWFFAAMLNLTVVMGAK